LHFGKHFVGATHEESLNHDHRLITLL